MDPELRTTHTRLYLQAAPDDIRSRNLPTAKAVTIARVASRLSTNRSYQPLVLQGLKTFLDGKRRLIKQGDLLAVKVDLNRLQYLQAASMGDSSETDTLGVGEGFAPQYTIPQTHGLMRSAGSLFTRQAQNKSCILS
jgi:peroxin-6